MYNPIRERSAGAVVYIRYNSKEVLKRANDFLTKGNLGPFLEKK